MRLQGLYGQELIFFFARLGEIEMSERFCQRLGWALAMIAVWATSGAAWGQEGQTPPAATGQYAAPAQAQQGGDPLTFDDIRRDLNSKNGKFANCRTSWREFSRLRPQRRPATEVQSAPCGPR